MSANSADKIYIAPKAKLYVAEVAAASAALPEDVETALPAAFKELGYTSADGIELTPSITTEPITVHQSAVPVKYVVSEAACTLAFTMMQWDPETVELYFGATIVTTTGVDKLVLDSVPALKEKALVVEWGDYTETGVSPDVTITGVKNRLVIPRGMVSEKEAITLTRTGAQQLGVTFSCLDQGGQLGYILTNSPTP